MKDTWYVYIIKCEDGSLYTGMTPDLKRRFQEHREGRGGRYTMLAKVEDEFIYHERYMLKEEAMRRERQIKGWRREKKENLIKYGKPNMPG